jgi:hypothetical protein
VVTGSAGGCGFADPGLCRRVLIIRGGPEVVEFVKRLGVVLDPWQLEVLRVSLMRSLDGSRWAAFAVAVCAPRQNGKNGITEIRELVGAALLGERLVCIRRIWRTRRRRRSAGSRI